MSDRARAAVMAWPTPRLTALPALLGAALVASLFWWNVALNLLPDFSGLVGYIAEHRLPLPGLVAVGAVAMESLGPAGLFARRSRPYAAAALALYCLLAALIFHQYWTLQGDARGDEQMQFFKDMALSGGFLLVAAQGLD
jgi:putative oxidoreductase